MRKWDKQSSRMPYQFKFVGLGMVILVILFFVAGFTDTIEIRPEHKALIKNVVFSFLLLGLCFIAFARDKIEDERTIFLKIKAFATSFGVAVFYVIFKPWINLLFETPTAVSGQEVALFMLLGYIFTYYLQKFTGEA